MGEGYLSSVWSVSEILVKVVEENIWLIVWSHLQLRLKM